MEPHYPQAFHVTVLASPPLQVSQRCPPVPAYPRNPGAWASTAAVLCSSLATVVASVPKARIIVRRKEQIIHLLLQVMIALARSPSLPAAWSWAVLFSARTNKYRKSRGKT